MGADHGVTEEGVSAYPREVTAQMLLNFARGGAAINVLARHAGARVVVVDMGVAAALPALPELRSHRIGAGTANFTRGPAMTRAQATAAIATGAEIAGELAARRHRPDRHRRDGDRQHHRGQRAHRRCSRRAPRAR